MVKVERMGVVEEKKIAKSGDLVMIGETPYLISTVKGELYLVSLDDGNWWRDEPLSKGSDLDTLVEYVDDVDCDPVEWVKQSDFDITIKIK